MSSASNTIIGGPETVSKSSGGVFSALDLGEVVVEDGMRVGYKKTKQKHNWTSQELST